MTTSGKTRKDQKDAKERNELFKARKEHLRVEKGGQRNLIREAEAEASADLEDALAELLELDDYSFSWEDPL